MQEIDGLLAERAAFAQKIQTWTPVKPDTAAALADWVILAGVALIKLVSLPSSKGYEPYFLEAGFPPIVACGLANVTIRSGERIASEAKHYQAVADAIRFLAIVRQKSATSRRARIILSAWRDTSVVETLFASAGLEESEFVRLLQELDDHGNTNYKRLAQLAALLVRHLSLSRGPKTSAASAAHAFLLEHEVPFPPRRRPHSRRDRTAENVDRLTEATRLEFCDPGFDSRPAKRRNGLRGDEHRPLAPKIT